jgi:hypothetical protein
LPTTQRSLGFGFAFPKGWFSSCRGASGMEMYFLRSSYNTKRALV